MMRKKSLRRATLPLLIGFVMLEFSGCAMFDRDNRVLLEKLDEHVRPESKLTRVAMAPLAIPVGSAALAVDAAVIHPIVVIPEAWDDVYELYWAPRDVELLRRIIFLGPIIVLTPPSFAGDWLIRSLFI